MRPQFVVFDKPVIGDLLHLLDRFEQVRAQHLVSNLYDYFGRRYRIQRDTAGSVTSILFGDAVRTT